MKNGIRKTIAVLVLSGIILAISEVNVSWHGQSIRVLSTQRIFAQEKETSSRSEGGTSAERDLSNLTYVQDLFKNIPHDFKLEVSIIEGKKDFVEGETVSFSIRSSQDTHVALFNHQVDGTIVILFPNVWDKETFIQANKTYYIPNLDKGKDYKPYVVPPFGVDVVQVVACTEANEFHKLIADSAKYTRSDIPFSTVTRGDFTRGLALAVEATEREFPSSNGPAKWSEAHLLINTQPKKK